MSTETDKTATFLTNVEFITGWRAIARHLWVSERTAKRWRKQGLLFRYFPSRRVFCLPQELRRWAVLHDSRKQVGEKAYKEALDRVKSHRRDE